MKGRDFILVHLSILPSRVLSLGDVWKLAAGSNLVWGSHEAGAVLSGSRGYVALGDFNTSEPATFSRAGAPRLLKDWTGAGSDSDKVIIIKRTKDVVG